MRLSELKIKEAGIVTKILLPKKSQQRLRELGICIGAMMELRETTLFHDPLLFEVDDTLLAIRKQDAQAIEIQRYTP